MVSIPTSRYKPDLEKEKFRTIGGSSNEAGIATQLYGETSANVVIPIKVVDDGNGRGKLVVTVE